MKWINLFSVVILCLLVLPSRGATHPRVSVFPREAKPGDTVHLRADGFTPNTPVTVFLDGNRLHGYLYFDDKGSFYEAIQVPPSLANGIHRFVVTDTYGNKGEGSLDVLGPNRLPTLSCGTYYDTTYNMPDFTTPSNSYNRVLKPYGPSGGEVWLRGDNWYGRTIKVTFRSLNTKDVLVPIEYNCLESGGNGYQLASSCNGKLETGVQVPQVPVGKYFILVDDGYVVNSCPYEVIAPKKEGENKPQPGRNNPPQQGGNNPPAKQDHNKPQTNGKPCNPDIPNYQQPGCIEH